jgi:hypothetical protein
MAKDVTEPDVLVVSEKVSLHEVPDEPVIVRPLKVATPLVILPEAAPWVMVHPVDATTFTAPVLIEVMTLPLPFSIFTTG